MHKPTVGLQLNEKKFQHSGQVDKVHEYRKRNLEKSLPAYNYAPLRTPLALIISRWDIHGIGYQNSSKPMGINVLWNRAVSMSTAIK